MKRTTALFPALAAALGTLSSAQAEVSFSSTAMGLSWTGRPVYSSVTTPGNSLTTGQGDPAITGANGVLAETFIPFSSFTLGSFSVKMQVTSAGSFGLHLYDLGPAGTVSTSSASATYSTGPDLLSGLSISLATNEAAVQGSFELSGADQVNLLGGEEYALEIWTPSAAGQNAFLWYLSSATFPGGQMFSAGDSSGIRATLAGNGQASGAPRTAGIALYGVPEPCTLALGGLALLALALRKRD